LHGDTLKSHFTFDGQQYFNQLYSSKTRALSVPSLYRFGTEGCVPEIPCRNDVSLRFRLPAEKSTMLDDGNETLADHNANLRLRLFLQSTLSPLHSDSVFQWERWQCTTGQRPVMKCHVIKCPSV